MSTSASTQNNPSGLLQALATTTVDTATLCWAQLARLSPLMAACLLIGTGIAALAKPEDRWAFALGWGVAFGYAAALALGATVLREAPQRSFLYSRPTSAPAIWWASLLSSIGLAAGLYAATLAPSLLIGPAIADLEIAWAFAAGLPLVFLISSTVRAILDANTGWRFVNLALLVSFVVVLVVVGRGVFSRHPSAITALFFVWLICTHLGMMCGGFLRTAKGRFDSRRGHRVFSVALWSALLLGIGATAIIARLLKSADFSDLTPQHIEFSDAGPWHTLSATDDRGGAVAWLRRESAYWFAFNEDTGATHLLAHVGASRSYSAMHISKATGFASETGAAFWMKGSRTQLVLARRGPNSDDLQELPLPWEPSTVLQWWVSPNEEVVIAIIAEWLLDAGRVTGSKQSIQAVGLRSRLLLAEVPLSSKQIDSWMGPSWQNNAFGSQWSLQWRNPTTAVVSLARSRRSYGRMAFDVHSRSFSELTRIGIDPSALHQGRPPRALATGMVPHFLQPWWNQVSDELWIASGAQILAYANAVSNQLRPPTRDIVTASAGTQIENYWHHGEWLLTVERSESWQSGVALYTEQPTGDWIVQDRSELKDVRRPQLRLDQNTFLLLDGANRTNSNPSDSALAVIDGSLRERTVASWLADNGLPHSETIQLSLGGHTYTLEDGSTWRTDPTTLQPRPVQIAATKGNG